MIELPASGSAPRLTDRMRVIAGAPSLMARQMQRVAAIHSEIREIVSLRLRHRHPDLSQEDVSRQAALVGHLIGGVLQTVAFLVEEGETGQTLADAMDQAYTALHHVLRDSAVPAL